MVIRQGSSVIATSSWGGGAQIKMKMWCIQGVLVLLQTPANKSQSGRMLCGGGGKGGQKGQKGVENADAGTARRILAKQDVICELVLEEVTVTLSGGHR